MSDTDTGRDVSSRRLYIGVIVCEAVTILGLWAFGRIFS
jgi:hypothetical protein